MIIHAQNRGYGGNQKTCYDAALEAGADIVVMLHPDYQYDATRIPALVEPIAARDARPHARQPVPRRPAGRWHADAGSTSPTASSRPSRTSRSGCASPSTTPGLRAYSRQLLETIPYHANSDDFVFDQELIAQVVAAGMRDRIGEIAVPTRYFEEASSVGFRRSVVYGLSTLRVVARYVLHRLRLRRRRS